MRVVLNKASQFTPLLFRRAMATKQFLVLVDDYPGALQKRIQVREKHLSAVGENQAVRVGGTPVSVFTNIRGLLFKGPYTGGSIAIQG
jgi:hypothetical protein